MKTVSFIALTTFVILSFGVMSAEGAPVPAISIDGITIENVFIRDGYSLGWEFTVNQPITVTALGLFDLGSVPNFDPSTYGLTESHDVGIYNSTGTSLLVSGTVSPGLSTNFFCYTSVTPTSLAVGDYVIAAVTGQDYYTIEPATFKESLGITFQQDRFILSSILAYPDQPEGITGDFGPNFQYEVAVPEPGILVLLAISMLTIFGLRLKWKA